MIAKSARIKRNVVDSSKFNRKAQLPYELRLKDFEMAMQDVYDFFFDEWMCVFVYDVDTETEPASKRKPMTFTEIYLGKVTVDDFRKNPRGELGTRTATLHKDGIAKLRENWIYRLIPVRSFEP